VDDPIPGRELIYFQGLVVGLQNDQIMYLETLPIGEAGLPYQEWEPITQETQETQESQISQGAQETPMTPSLTGTVIYTVNDDGNYEVYALDLATGQEVNLSSSSAEDVYAACSPETDIIYFISDRSGVDQVYTINRDGNNLQQITDSSSSKEYLNWYSASELIYWQWGGSLENSYVLYDFASGQETPVEEDVGQAYSTSIAVSPGAELIAKSEKRTEDDYEIWIKDLYSGEETQITDNDIADTNPVWSPDGSLLIYASQGDLWSYDRQDGTTSQVTQTEGWSESSACWLEN
jgi:Tol biopolymer transport system component